jgi:osmotically-inducible protein OsmY
MRADESIKKDMVDELCWDSRTDASKIHVEVENGVVTVSGRVPTFHALSIARNAAWRIAGVVRVIDRLTVSLASIPLPPDDPEIKSRAESLCAWDPDIDGSEILIGVSGGSVTLEGTVDSYWKKPFVDSKISGIRGVAKIENRLAVVPSKRISDELIARDIMATLDRDSLVDPGDVTVEVRNGVVSLSGNVSSWVSRRSAELDAAHTAGVVDVDNRLNVLP